jgi:hypothetical protein
MRKFVEFLLHLFASFCMVTLFSLLAILYDLPMYHALNSFESNEISSDVDRIYEYHVAGLVFRYLAAVAGAVISLLVLRKTSKTYWIAGVVFIISIIGMHLKFQQLFLYISFTGYMRGEVYVKLIINSVYLIGLASTAYYFSYRVARSS